MKTQITPTFKMVRNADGARFLKLVSVDEKQLIQDLHEQLSLWFKKSTKKDKSNAYACTVETLRKAESYLANNGKN